MGDAEFIVSVEVMLEAPTGRYPALDEVAGAGLVFNPTGTAQSPDHIPAGRAGLGDHHATPEPLAAQISLCRHR
ncbi:MAG TPA: hypothetical protein VEO53_03275, partial [Candidatus Binatia bacterium]|nr:hypothetical protein [Candidatus Binatia bacterium]